MYMKTLVGNELRKWLSFSEAGGATVYVCFVVKDELWFLDGQMEKVKRG